MAIFRKHPREITSLIIALLLGGIVEYITSLNWLVMFFVILALFAIVSAFGPKLHYALHTRFSFVRSLEKAILGQISDFQQMTGEDFRKEAEQYLGENGKIDFVLYFDAPPQSAFQVQMWMPFLKMLNRPFLIIVRGSKNDRELHLLKFPAVRVIYQVDMAIAEELGAKTVFYVNNGMRNAHMLRYHKMTHIQLLHGESDKAPSYNPFTAIYDFVFVAGQAGIDRYSSNDVFIPSEKFRIVSRPQTSGIEVARGSSEDKSKTIFYATTWSGYSIDTNVTSIEIADKIVQRLIDLGHTIIFRPHPYCYKDKRQAKIIKKIGVLLKKETEKTGLKHCISNDSDFGRVYPNINDCINVADVMVADITSVLADWLFSTKPYVSIDTDNNLDDFIAENPIVKGGYIFSADMKDFDAEIAKATGDDPLREQRLKLRKHVLGVDLDDDPVEMFLSVANDVIDNFDKVAHTKAKIKAQQ